MNDDPLTFVPMTDQDHRALGYVYELLRRQAEDWYIKVRREIGCARVAFDVVVLKPLCEDCCARLGRKSLSEQVLYGKEQAELVILLPEDVVPDRVRLYDGASRCVHLWPPNEPLQEPHRVRCSMCGQRVDSSDGDDIIHVYEVPFQEYFGFLNEEEEGPKRKRGKAERNRIRELYGASCFNCGTQLDPNNFTLDHIIARSRDGPTVSLNLQPLCHNCNQQKRDLPVTTVKIALDMLLRPLPSDSHEGPIW